MTIPNGRSAAIAQNTRCRHIWVARPGDSPNARRDRTASSGGPAMARSSVASVIDATTIPYGLRKGRLYYGHTMSIVFIAFLASFGGYAQAPPPPIIGRWDI